jgi:hypothetical protein
MDAMKGKRKHNWRTLTYLASHFRNHLYARKIVARLGISTIYMFTTLSHSFTEICVPLNI